MPLYGVSPSFNSFIRVDERTVSLCRGVISHPLMKEVNDVFSALTNED